ncbi:MAG: 2-octaprenyl-6-methoxyphenyl hydroxylase, partial [Thermoanaerobaculia bacterium]|nr:2-octaprenyl-6-methoxyphenyl hydroxylase [Thermoanaerobaculia bacterium]
RNGPIALLPLPDGRSGAVWTQTAQAAQARMQLDDRSFLSALQEQFGYRLGRLTRLGRRASHPLLRISSARTTSDRVVLIGNAAQTLHPIAAQGFNLGLRDALGWLLAALWELGRVWWWRRARV